MNTNIRIVPIQQLCVACGDELQERDTTYSLASWLCRACIRLLGEQKTSPDTEGVLAEVALGAPGRFAAFDDLITLTVRAADRDERHGPFLPKRDYEDEAQCDSNLDPSPLLKHYPGQISGPARPFYLQHRLDFVH